METALAIDDVAYAVRDGETLLARIYRSRHVGAGAATVVAVHPGAWHAGDRTWGHVYLEGLAQRRLVVVSIDFRQAPRFRHPAASADVASAVRWLRTASAELEVDPSKIALVGSSSGGHLALLAACRPNEAEHVPEPLAQTVDASVSCVAALWAPVDPLARYRFVLDQLAHGSPDERALYEDVRHGAESYFGDEQTMESARVAGIVAAGEATHVPPAWVCYPELETTIPFAMAAELERAWRAAGGELTVRIFPGQGHAFAHRPGEATDRLIDELAAFFDEVWR